MFSVFPILFLLSHNIEEGNYSEAILSISISLGLTAILISSLLLIFRDIKKSTIVVSLFILLFYSYGHFYSLVLIWQINDFIIVRHRYILIFYGVVFFLLAYRIIKSNKNYDIATSLLNIISVTLIILPVINIGTHIFKAKNISVFDNRTMGYPLFIAIFRLLEFIKINTGVDNVPVWSDAAGIVVGAVAGIYVPPLIIDMF